MENQETNPQASWGRVLLIIGALPAGLLSCGMLFFGVLGLLGGLSATSSLDLGAAFGWFFAILLLPSGVLTLLFLILSRLKKRIPAIIGSAGSLLLAYLGLIALLLMSDFQNRIDSTLYFSILSGVFLITGLSGFVGWALRGLIGKRWGVGSSIAGLILVIGFTLVAALTPVQLNASRQILEGHTAPVREVAFSPDGTYLASGDRDGTVLMWDMSGDGLPESFDPGDLAGGNLTWSPDGKLITTSLEGAVVIWDAGTGAQIRTLPGSFDTIRDLAWSPDMARLAALVDDQTIVVWDVESGEEVNRLVEKWFTVLGGAVWWSLDGKIAAYEKVKKLVILWDPDTGEWEEFLEGVDDSKVRVASWLPDGTRLAVGTHDRAISIWDVAAGEEILTMGNNTSVVDHLAWSPDGMTIAAPDIFGVLLWDTATGNLSQDINCHAGVIWQAAWSPDGEVLATANADGTIMLWSVDPS